MLEWPGRCGHCQNHIEDWSDAGLYGGHWIHKVCYTTEWTEAQNAGSSVPDLRSPVDRSSQLELPMLVFILLFHFGLGGAVLGWIMVDQGQSPDLGLALLVIGIVLPLIGIAGVARNIVSRRRIEAIRRELDLAGGWKPGR